MGMSTHVIALQAPDEQWQKMKAVYDACTAAGIPVPDEVDVFFCGKPPDPSGVEVEIQKTAAVKKIVGEESRDGFIVSIKYLIKHYPLVTHIKFYNSY